MSAIQLSLVDNALDYVERAIADAAQNEANSWKYAVLHLFAGIELLFKERLRREHWSLLFTDVDKANAHVLTSGEFRSVDFDSCHKRLNQIVGIVIETQQLRELDALRKLRNRLQHFDVQITEDQVKSQLVLGVSFFISFFRKHLPDLAENKRLQRILERLEDFRAFVAASMAQIKPNLDQATLCWPCPECSQKTLVIGNTEPECLFCGFRESAVDLALLLHEGGSPEQCPKCDEHTRILYLLNNDESGWACMNCGDHGLHTTCQMCGCELDRAYGICEKCLPKQIAQMQAVLKANQSRSDEPLRSGESTTPLG